MEVEARFGKFGINHTLVGYLARGKKKKVRKKTVGLMDKKRKTRLDPVRGPVYIDKTRVGKAPPLRSPSLNRPAQAR